MLKYLIRFLDIFLSCFTLIFFLPLLLFIAIVVGFFDGYPIIYVQNRLGLNGKVFKLFKFRTMSIEDKEDKFFLGDDNAVNPYSVKIKNDPRITNVGLLLRKTSLDELPQFLNVIRGEMSLVGPRPWIEEEYLMFPSDWNAGDRLLVKPGITGYAQINGRSDLSPEKIIELDIYWVENFSILFYIKILALTFLKFFKVLLGFEKNINSY